MFSGLRNPRQAAAQVLNFALVLSTAFMVRLSCSSWINSHVAARRQLSLLQKLTRARANLQMWKGLSVISDSPSPIVVVLSGSMEPAFQRGDLLFLWNRNIWEDTTVGDIVVYNIQNKDIPIVHRVVRSFGSG
jgi:signal peptidase